MKKKKTIDKKQAIECDTCGKEFEPTVYWARFCSRPCRDTWHSQVRAKVSEEMRKDKLKKENDNA